MNWPRDPSVACTGTDLPATPMTKTLLRPLRTIGYSLLPRGGWQAEARLRCGDAQASSATYAGVRVPDIPGMQDAEGSLLPLPYGLDALPRARHARREAASYPGRSLTRPAGDVGAKPVLLPWGRRYGRPAPPRTGLTGRSRVEPPRRITSYRRPGPSHDSPRAA